MTTAFAYPNADLQPGDLVTVPQRPEWGVLEVTDTKHASLVKARRADGVVLDVGRGAVELLDADEVRRCFDVRGDEPTDEETEQ